MYQTIDFPIVPTYDLLLLIRSTYRYGGSGVQLVLGRDAKAGAVTPCGPGQVHSSLQLVIHLLVDGPTEFLPSLLEHRHEP